MKHGYKIASKVLRLSSWASVASWICLGIALLASRFDIRILSSFAMTGGAACVAISVIGEEIGLRIYTMGRKTWGLIAIALVLVAFGAFIHGFAINDINLAGSALVSLFVISFIPHFVDIFSTKNQPRLYSSGSYPADPWAMLGMETPKTPPPIIIGKGEDLDEEWTEYLGVNVPNVEDIPDNVEYISTHELQDNEIRQIKEGENTTECIVVTVDASELGKQEQETCNA